MAELLRALALLPRDTDSVSSDYIQLFVTPVLGEPTPCSGFLGQWMYTIHRYIDKTLVHIKLKLKKKNKIFKKASILGE